MRKPFQYSVLYYQHSQISEERFAIGILFFFPGDSELSFIIPASLQKLSAFQSDFDTAFVRKILKSFDAKAKEITHEWKSSGLNIVADNFLDIINSKLIVPDSSAIQFSEPKGGIVPEDKEKIKTYYQSLFFKNYTQVNLPERLDEPKILNRFSSLFKQRLKNPNKYFKQEIIVKGQFFEEKFEYGWQNGKFNLVSPISFDLAKEDSIKKKSQQQIGILSNLEKTVKEKDYSVHFLVARPTQKSLFNAYENALAILETYQKDSVGRVIDFNNDIEKYIEEINDTAKPLRTSS